MSIQIAEQRIRLAAQRNQTSLDLSGLSLTTLPGSIENLTQLTFLDLHFNKLTTLPKHITNFTKLTKLDLSENKLITLPDVFTNLIQLKKLYLSGNQLTTLPKSIERLTQLTALDLNYNRFTTLPQSIANFTQLTELYLSGNQLTTLPESIESLTQLTAIDLHYNRLTTLPKSIANFTQLTELYLSKNQLATLPAAIANLTQLSQLTLSDNPLPPELLEAYEEGLDSLRAYLKAQGKSKVKLTEVKLILIGEGEVGKSCLLDALAGKPWKRYPSTQGIRIEPFVIQSYAANPTIDTIRFNGWDFGGQKVYRPTHQLFFSAPAVYLVVWKPREGPEQDRVEEWIQLVKLREPEARMFIVATHGGPEGRQPDMDRQVIWDKFGRDRVLEFFHVENEPDEISGERTGIPALQKAIFDEAERILTETHWERPGTWQGAWEALLATGKPYVTVDEACETSQGFGMDEEETRLFIRLWHKLGYLIHYSGDPELERIVILKPDWLTQALSYVLDDKLTRQKQGLITASRLAELWDDPNKGEELRYETSLHSLFRKLMARFDLAYPAVYPPSRQPVEETLLIGQLVEDLRPEGKLAAAWPEAIPEGEEEKIQLCRIVTADKGESAKAEGLFYQLIVRLHKFSLGRDDFEQSVHWQRGLVIEDSYNGRARLDHVGNDIRITVRAADPKTFLAVLTGEVKWLVESFWEGLKCQILTPCLAPCGKGAPGTGFFEVEKLLESKRKKRLEYPCPQCEEWQSVGALLDAGPSAQRPTDMTVLREIAELKDGIEGVRSAVIHSHVETVQGIKALGAGLLAIMSQADDRYNRMMYLLTDEAKEGPRLISIEPVDPGFFDRPKRMAQKFRLALWCEHSRQPLPLLNPDDPTRGVYEIELTREWVTKAAPVFKMIMGTLGIIVPVLAASGKAFLDEAVFKGVENQLSLGEKALDAVIKTGEKTEAWATRDNAKDIVEPDESQEFAQRQDAAERGGPDNAFYVRDGMFRQIQELLKKRDPGFGGLVRVRNNKEEFLWVHERFRSEYPG